MASVVATLEVKTSGMESLKTTATGFEGVGQAAKRAEQSLKEWDNTAQRAAMKMERMHEEALKMNASLKGTNDSAQLFASTLSTMSSTATSTAAAFGMNIGPLTTLNQIIPVTAIGFKGLTTAAVGFNAATLGVVGAALAAGAAIGTLMRALDVLPGIPLGKWLDEGAVGMLRMAGRLDNLQPKMTQIEQTMRNAAVTAQKLAEANRGKENVTAELERQQAEIEGERRLREARNEAFEERQRNGKKAEALAQQLMAGQLRAWDQEISAAKKFQDAKDAIFLKGAQMENERRKTLEERASDTAKRIAEAYIDGKKKEEKAAEEDYEIKKKFEEAALRDREKQIAAMRNLADTMLRVGAAAGGAFGTILSLGGAALQVMANLKDQTLQNLPAWQKLGGLIEGAFAAFQSGSVLGGAGAGAMAGSAFGPWGAAIGGVVGGVLGFLGKGKKEAAEAKKMLEEFIKGSGGLEALQAAADRAGVSLEALFDAKKPKEMEKAIADVQRQLDMFGDAWARVDEAAQRYGLTIEDMTAGGAALARQMEGMFEQIYGDYILLTEAGYDNLAVLTKMAPSVNEYIQAAKRSGIAIPESMRPILQQMLDAGLLTDEFGNKLTDLSGITFAESITDSVKRIEEAIWALVDALRNGIDGANGLGTALGGMFGNVSGGVGPPPSNYEGKGQVPLNAEGGFYRYRPGGHLVIVGEKEDEYAIPKSKMGGVTGGGSVTVNAPLTVRVDGSGLSAEVLAAKLSQVWTTNTGGAVDRAKDALGLKRIA